MLQHVVEAEIFDLVICCVDLLIGLLKLGFDDKGRRISILACGRMV